MEKRNILFMGIHSELTLFVLISEWQDFESVLTWPFSAGLLLPQCSCHINSSSPNLESVMGSGINSFVFFSGTRLLISPCSHLRKCTDSCQDESWLFLRHTWRPNLWLIDRSSGHRLSHQELPLSRQVQAWGITSDSQQESKHWQNSCVNLLLWLEDMWLFLTPPPFPPESCISLFIAPMFVCLFMHVLRIQGVWPEWKPWGRSGLKVDSRGHWALPSSSPSFIVSDSPPPLHRCHWIKTMEDLKAVRRNELEGRTMGIFGW